MSEAFANMLLLDLRRDFLPNAQPREQMSSKEKQKETSLLKDLFAWSYGVTFYDFKKSMQHFFHTKDGG